jgi:hypothetical protein
MNGQPMAIMSLFLSERPRQLFPGIDLSELREGLVCRLG